MFAVGEFKGGNTVNRNSENGEFAICQQLGIRTQTQTRYFSTNKNTLFAKVRNASLCGQRDSPTTNEEPTRKQGTHLV